MKFLDKLLALIFFGAAATFFAVTSIIEIIAMINTFIDWGKNSYFSFGMFLTMILSIALCGLIIVICVLSGLRILMGDKLRGIQLFKAIVTVPTVYAAIVAVLSVIGLITGIVHDYGGTYIANEIIDIILYAGAAVVGVMAFLTKEIDFQKKLFAMICFGLCGLAVFIGFFFGFSALGLFLFSIWALGVVIMVLNKFEQSNN